MKKVKLILVIAVAVVLITVVTETHSSEFLHRIPRQSVDVDPFNVHGNSFNANLQQASHDAL